MNQEQFNLVKSRLPKCKCWFNPEMGRVQCRYCYQMEWDIGIDPFVSALSWMAIMHDSGFLVL